MKQDMAPGSPRFSQVQTVAGHDPANAEQVQDALRNRVCFVSVDEVVRDSASTTHSLRRPPSANGYYSCGSSLKFVILTAIETVVIRALLMSDSLICLRV